MKGLELFSMISPLSTLLRAFHPRVIVEESDEREKDSGGLVNGSIWARRKHEAG